MKGLQYCISATIAVVLVVTSGCSKKQSQEMPPPPSNVTIQKSDIVQPPPRKNTDSATAVSSSAEVLTNAAVGEETPEQLAAQVKQLEAEYQSTADFQKRVVIIYNLSSTESPDTIDAVSRLFLNEKDQELKVELVDSLMDIDGQNDKKLAILSTAMRTDQPKEVRLEAIDGMGNVEDKRAIQVLQAFLTDPDEEIREAAQDTIDQLNLVTNPPPETTPGVPQPGLPAR